MRTLLAGVVIATLSGCASAYVPAAPAAPLVISPRLYVKDGVTHERDFLRARLEELTEDVPEAAALARTARRQQLAGVVADLLGAVAGLGTVPVAIVDPRHFNGVAANALLNSSLVLAVLGPALHFLSANRELDAVNVYNDGRRTRELATRPRPRPAEEPIEP